MGEEVRATSCTTVKPGTGAADVGVARGAEGLGMPAEEPRIDQVGFGVFWGRGEGAGEGQNKHARREDCVHEVWMRVGFGQRQRGVPGPGCYRAVCRSSYG